MIHGRSNAVYHHDPPIRVLLSSCSHRADGQGQGEPCPLRDWHRPVRQMLLESHAPPAPCTLGRSPDRLPPPPTVVRRPPQSRRRRRTRRRRRRRCVARPPLELAHTCTRKRSHPTHSCAFVWRDQLTKAGLPIWNLSRLLPQRAPGTTRTTDGSLTFPKPWGDQWGSPNFDKTRFK